MSGADDSPSSLIGPEGRSVTTISDEVARLDQALLDHAYSQASSVQLIHCSLSRHEAQLVRQLAQTAGARRFVVAHVSLAETPLDAIDDLVSALLDALVDPGDKRSGGILRLLSNYDERHGKKSSERFAEACEESESSGELTALCHSYLSASDDASREVSAFSKWCAGIELTGRMSVPGVRGTLSPHTGQRVFCELSRIVQALGYPGLLVLLSEGDSIADRSPRQRERGYTLLRELVDNFDAGEGATATRITITGGDALFSGPRSLRELAPLWARLKLPSHAEPPPPHRTWTSLIREPFEYVHRKVRLPKEVRPTALRSLIRISQGLPPVDAVAAMSVGHERIDKTIDRLFHHAEMSGSVFQVLSGEYGSGKTHLLLHLAERASSSGHPVFWLNLERMNLDLGNPARHLTRVLERSVLPGKRRPSALDRLSSWTRSARKTKQLIDVLERIAETGSEEAKTAKKALSLVQEQEDPGAILERFLCAQDLTEKSSGQSYRLDAYRRLLLWVELLRLMEDAQGPVILIDEAENLYTSGVSESKRRSALRTLAFYCGGALPGACVIMAMTPTALTAMKREASGLLREAAEVSSTLDIEDVELFRRRLHALKPDEVPTFTMPMRRELAKKVRAVHKQVRGTVNFPDWELLVEELVKDGGSPRTMMRHLVDELEAAWWAGG